MRERKAADDIIDVARRLSAEALDRPSPLDGWTYKDLLAHLASNDDMRYLLRSVIEKTELDGGRFRIGGAAELNAKNVSARRGRTLDELIAEFEAQEEETQELYAGLSDADESFRAAFHAYHARRRLARRARRLPFSGAPGAATDGFGRLASYSPIPSRSR